MWGSSRLYGISEMSSLHIPAKELRRWRPMSLSILSLGIQIPKSGHSSWCRYRWCLKMSKNAWQRRHVVDALDKQRAHDRKRWREDTWRSIVKKIEEKARFARRRVTSQVCDSSDTNLINQSVRPQVAMMYRADSWLSWSSDVHDKQLTLRWEKRGQGPCKENSELARLSAVNLRRLSTFNLEPNPPIL